MAEGNEPKTYSEQEYEAFRSQLEDARKQLESYQETDIEAIKASAEDFKKKWEQSEQKRKSFEHNTKISAYVKSLGLKDDIYEKYISDRLTEAGLKFDGDKLIGGDEIVKKFKETHADAFKSNEPILNPVAPTSTQGGIMGLTKELFSRMGYAERLKLKKKNPEIYEKMKDEV